MALLSLKRDIADGDRIKDTTNTKKARILPESDKTSWSFRVQDHFYSDDQTEGPLHILYTPDDSPAAVHFVALLKAHLGAAPAPDEEGADEKTPIIVPDSPGSSSSSGAELEKPRASIEEEEGEEEEEEEEDDEDDNNHNQHPLAKLLGLLLYLVGEHTQLYHPNDRPTWLAEDATVGVFRKETHLENPTWATHSPPYAFTLVESNYD